MTARFRLKQEEKEGRLSLLVLALVAGAWAACPAHGADTKPEAKPKLVFPPEAEPKYAEFIKQVVEAKRKLWGEHMQREIEEVKTLAGLDGAPVKALDTAAQAVNLCLESWTVKLDDYLRQGWAPTQSAKQMFALLDVVMQQPAPYAENEWPGGYPLPSEHPVWTDALRRTLSPEQFAAWDKLKTERRAAFDKEIGPYLDNQFASLRPTYSQGVLTESNSIARTLGLPEARARALDALANNAVDQCLKQLREATEKGFLTKTADGRRQAIAERSGLKLTGEILPENQPVWRDDLAKFLSEDERKQFQAAQEERNFKRIRVMGQVLLVQLDDRVALTARQRQQLQPLAERLAKGETTLFPKVGSDIRNAGFSPALFCSAARKASPEDLQAVLDPVQQKRWREAGTSQNANDNTATTPVGAGVAEPEDVERAISDFLCRKADLERRRLLDIMSVKAEDAARGASLSPGAAHRLQSAARGTVEAALDDWKSTLDETVRSQVQDSTPHSIQASLEGIDRYYFREIDLSLDKETLWDKTLKAELTDAQQAAWKQELDARSLYRDQSITAFLLAEFDRRMTLSTQQAALLETRLSGIVKEYGPDIAHMYSSGNTRSWYLQGYIMFLPLGSLSTNDLKAILGKDQMQRWLGSVEFTYITRYWENIQTNHELRMLQTK